jgi:hypothetical protein
MVFVHKKLWSAVLVMLMISVTIMGCGSSDSQIESTKSPDKDTKFAILSEKEEQGVKTYSTVYGEFSYPTEFAEGIDVKASTKQGIPTLVFVINLNDRDASLFTIRYGGKEGIPFGTYQSSGEGEMITLYVSFAEMPPDLTADERDRFEAAQEVFNDVIASMEKNSEFEGL